MTDQQKLDAVRDGTGQAFFDWINCVRDISTQDSIEAGVDSAFERWLDKHSDEIIEAIARRGSAP
jgi:hypothetical protein